MKIHVDYQGLLDRIRRTVNARETANFMVVTDANHSVVISVENGEIAYLSCGPRRGLAAIPEIRRMRSGNLDMITRDPMIHRLNGLPAARQLLSLLAGEVVDLEEQDAPTEPAADSAQAGEEKASSIAWSGASVQTVRDLLVNHIGPIADLVLDDALESVGEIRTRADLDKLIAEIGRDLEGPEQCARFEQALLAKLQP